MSFLGECQDSLSEFDTAVEVASDHEHGVVARNRTQQVRPTRSIKGASEVLSSTRWRAHYDHVARMLHSDHEIRERSSHPMFDHLLLRPIVSRRQDVPKSAGLCSCTNGSKIDKIT